MKDDASRKPFNVPSPQTDAMKRVLEAGAKRTQAQGDAVRARERQISETPRPRTRTSPVTRTTNEG